MHVAHFESGAIAAQSAWSQRGQAALVRQLRQRIRLIHELRELRAAKEIANHRAEGFGIHQLLWRHPVDVDVEQSHALFYESFRASETNAALIGEQFANRSHATAAEVIDVVERAFAPAKIDQVFDRGDEILVGQNPLGKIDIDAELLVDLVTADASEVVFLRIEKESLEQGAGVGHRRRISGAEFAVNIL